MSRSHAAKSSKTSSTFRPPSALLRRVSLTPRETEVVRLIAEGFRSAEIAEQLSIRVKTVETHRTNVYNKLGFTRMAGLVRYAVRENLVKI